MSKTQKPFTNLSRLKLAYCDLCSRYRWEEENRKGIAALTLYGLLYLRAEIVFAGIYSLIFYGQPAKR